MNIRKSLSKDAENQKKMTTEEGYEFKRFFDTSTKSRDRVTLGVDDL